MRAPMCTRARCARAARFVYAAVLETSVTCSFFSSETVFTALPRPARLLLLYTRCGGRGRSARLVAGAPCQAPARSANGIQAPSLGGEAEPRLRGRKLCIREEAPRAPVHEALQSVEPL